MNKFFSTIALVSALALGLAAPASADGPKHIGGSSIQVGGTGWATGGATSIGKHTENYTASAVGFDVKLKADDCGCVGGVIKGTAGQLSQSFASGPGFSAAGSGAMAGIEASLKVSGSSKVGKK